MFEAGTALGRSDGQKDRKLKEILVTTFHLGMTITNPMPQKAGAMEHMISATRGLLRLLVKNKPSIQLVLPGWLCESRLHPNSVQARDQKLLLRQWLPLGKSIARRPRLTLHFGVLEQK